MRIWFSRYELKPKASLGAHAIRRAREGALLKIAFEDGSVGYSDLHPWTELGDAPLTEQLRSLTSNQPTPLASRSLKLAKLDADARRENVSAFKGLTVPESHYLFTDSLLVTPDSVSTVIENGFAFMKLKVGEDLDREKRILEALFEEETVASEIILRLDFNSKLTKSMARSWLLALNESVNDAIDFVEDPCHWNAGDWRRLHDETGVNLYRDFGSEENFAPRLSLAGAEKEPGYQGLVVKPAVQDVSRLIDKDVNLVVTSYLDHPVGQMGAALEAARLNAEMSVGVCGLLSHFAYETTAYAEQIPAEGPELSPISTEPGIGFTDLLSSENWQPL